MKLKLKRLFLLLLGATFVFGCAYVVVAHNARQRVNELISRAHSRGLATDFDEITNPRGLGTAELRGMSGITSQQELARLGFSEDKVSRARELLVSADPYFTAIRDFATTELYSPQRIYNVSTTYNDYSTIRAAIEAEGWLGYVSASDGNLKQALSSLKSLKGLMARSLDEGAPIGMLVARSAERWIWRTAVCMARNAKTADEIAAIEQLTASLEPIDFKSSLSWLLTDSLSYVRGVETGDLVGNPPTRFLNIEFRFTESSVSLDSVRADVLGRAIDLHDNWDKLPVNVAIPGSLEDDGLHGLADDLDLDAHIFRREETNERADRRALALTLAAYKHKLESGKVPTIQQLSDKGLNATDPWNGKPMTLQQSDGRLWIGAQRPTALGGDTTKLVEVLGWRR